MDRPVRSRPASLYALLLVLYPADFRATYGTEMAQIVDDLVRERGRGAWARVALDLAVSVPRTRLESLMHRAPATPTVTVTIFATGVLASLGALLVFGPAGVPVPLLAVAVLLSQRSSLARALGPREERHGPRLAAVGVAVSTVVFLATLAAWFAGVERGYSFGDTVLLAFNVLGFGSAVGIVGFGAAALTRRRLRRERPVA